MYYKYRSQPTKPRRRIAPTPLKPQHLPPQFPHSKANNIWEESPCHPAFSNSTISSGLKDAHTQLQKDITVWRCKNEKSHGEARPASGRHKQPCPPEERSRTNADADSAHYISRKGLKKSQSHQPSLPSSTDRKESDKQLLNVTDSLLFDGLSGLYSEAIKG